MARELYRQIDIEHIRNAKNLLDCSDKCWEWAEKKAIADYINSKWRFMR